MHLLFLAYINLYIPTQSHLASFALLTFLDVTRIALRFLSLQEKIYMFFNNQLNISQTSQDSSKISSGHIIFHPCQFSSSPKHLWQFILRKSYDSLKYNATDRKTRVPSSLLLLAYISHFLRFSSKCVRGLFRQLCKKFNFSYLNVNFSVTALMSHIICEDFTSCHRD